MTVALLKNSPAYIFEKTSNITIVHKTLDKQNWKFILILLVLFEKQQV